MTGIWSEIEAGYHSTRVIGSNPLALNENPRSINWPGVAWPSQAEVELGQRRRGRDHWAAKSFCLNKDLEGPSRIGTASRMYLSTFAPTRKTMLVCGTTGPIARPIGGLAKG